MALVLAQAAAEADELQLTFAGGRVTLVARGVPLREVLAAWAQAGRMRFIDADAVGGEPVTLRLLDVDEGEALRTLLRPAGGYIAARRRVAAGGAARFDRVKVLPAGPPPPPGGSLPPARASAAAPLSSPDGDVQLDHLQALLEQAAGPATRPESEVSPGAPPGAASPALLSARPGIAGEPQRPPRWRRPRGRTPAGADAGP